MPPCFLYLVLNMSAFFFSLPLSMILVLHLIFYFFLIVQPPNNGVASTNFQLESVSTQYSRIQAVGIPPFLQF